jgi:Flp pilus assembly protein TadG
VNTSCCVPSPHGPSHHAQAPPQTQRGVAAVEFALVSTVLFMLLFGVIELGRMLWTWNAAVESTRLGARLAAVCDIDRSSNAPIKTRMREMLPALANGNIVVEYMNPADTVDATCTNDNCKAVRVQLSNFTHSAIIPFAPLTVTMPNFATIVRKEFMSSTGNEVCP